MISRKYIQKILLLLLLLAGTVRNNVYSADIPQVCRHDNSILKSEIIVESKGTIQALPEICNGGSFQQTIHKLKNSFGSNSSFAVKQNAALSFISEACPAQSETVKIPLFLFNRSILI